MAPTGRPGQDHVEGAGLADQPRQAHRAAIDQRHAPAPAEDAEHRILLGHPEVAPAGQLQPAGHGMARNGGDHRLGELEPGRPHGPVGGQRAGIGGGRHGAVAAAVADGLEVGPGAERAAGAPQHGHRALSSASKARKARASASAVGRSTALRTSGRSRITVVTGPDLTLRTVSRSAGVWVMAGCPLRRRQRLMRAVRSASADPAGAVCMGDGPFSRRSDLGMGGKSH